MMNKTKILPLGLLIIIVTWIITLLDSKFPFFTTKEEDLGLGVLMVVAFMFIHLISFILISTGVFFSIKSFKKSKSKITFFLIILGVLLIIGIILYGLFFLGAF